MYLDFKYFHGTISIMKMASIFPMISRVAARSIAMDLVAVEPMDAPTGLLFYLDAAASGFTINMSRKTLLENFKYGN